MNLACALLVASVLLTGAEAEGFGNVREGDVVESAALRSLAGGQEQFLTRDRAGVFLFFSPEQDYSKLALQALFRLEAELSSRPLTFVAITSGRHPEAFVKEALANDGGGAPTRVLYDDGDAQYGKLGGKLTPIIGVVDAQHRLVAYVPFRKVNLEAVVRAWALRALGELDDAGVQRALNPETVTMGGDAEVARRHLKMAERLLKAEAWTAAVDSAQKAVSHDDSLAAAHAALGAALAGAGRCAEALVALDRARALDPAQAEREGPSRSKCAAP